MLFFSSFFGAASLHAQMPFYTDDTSVTAPQTLHVEIFDEFDGLQSSQFPDERQNTANVKVNFSPLNRLELDVDVPGVARRFMQKGATPNGMDAPAFNGISCAKVEVSSNHLTKQERPI